MIRDVKSDIAEFFKLPLEARKVHAQLPDGLEGYGQVFVFSEAQKLDWSDMLYLMLRPVESRDMRFWPVQPPSFRSPLMTCAGRPPPAGGPLRFSDLLQGANLSVVYRGRYVRSVGPKTSTVGPTGAHPEKVLLHPKS